jgi:curved DNA-binding protein CbpA
MRGIDELDHYELLEISTSASEVEIDRAYRLSQQTYGDGSLALYSVFENGDAAAIRERLDEAFRVLSDSGGRAAYDASLAAEGGTSDANMQIDLLDDRLRTDVAESQVAIESVDEVIDGYDAFEDDADGEFDGLRLRRARLFRGYEIDDITDVTKVSGTHLRNIEEENFGDLPADVYVRGFVTAYAKTIGLDPEAVVPTYMARVQESRTASQSGRFLGRN